MPEIALAIGNRNYSSWSLRGWLAAKLAGLEFEEVVIPLDRPETQPAIRRISPSGWLPVLTHGGLAIWDSLAIAEYLNDLKPEAKMWPEALAARAVARAVSAEMHSGFLNLRREMPMNIRASYPGRGLTTEVRAEIERVVGIWRDCRKRFSSAGAKDDGFLFGAPSIADAMFAPVVTRFVTYGVALDADAKAYVDAVMRWAPMAAWCEAAKHEPWLIEKYEFR
jgi:glutathione S-transferase